MFDLTLSGTVGNLPELAVTSAGTPVFKVSVAVRGWDGKQETTTWVSCVGWEKMAERLDKFNIGKGDFFVASGRPKVRAYTDRNGNPQAALELIIRDFDVKHKVAPAAVPASPDTGDVFKPDWEEEGVQVG